MSYLLVGHTAQLTAQSVGTGLAPVRKRVSRETLGSVQCACAPGLDRGCRDSALRLSDPYVI